MDHFNLNNSLEIDLCHLDFISITGEDAFAFLQGQCTQDISLSLNQLVFSSIVNLQGQIQALFGIIHFENVFYILVPKFFSNHLLEHFEKYIFAEDINILKIENQNTLVLELNCTNNHTNNEINYCEFKFNGFASKIKETNNLNGIVIDNYFEMELLNLKIILDKNIKNYLNQKIYETSFNENCINFKKGCFLGQELLAKIENNRKASIKECFIEIDKIELDSPINEISYMGIDEKKYKLENFINFNYKNKIFLFVKLPREFRSNLYNLNLIINGQQKIIGKVLILPFENILTNSFVAKELNKKASDFFINNEINKAIDITKRAIEIDCTNLDLYESLATLYFRNKEFDKAINQMDELLKIDPDSVMAHTNKSLYLMNQGKIEEAEKEKDLATIASFKAQGKLSKEKKASEQLKSDQSNQNAKQKQMFLEVLDIDPQDEFARIGLLKIYRFEDDFNAYKNLFETFKEEEIIKSPTLLFEQYYLLKENKEEARNVLEKALLLSNKAGNKKLSLDIQTQLNKM